ncbi:MAG: hypothetical protein Q9219_004857 [cf. Caloplaca sp. 3 TL-2023]
MRQSLDDLGTDILSIILDYLQADSPNSLLSVLLTSKRFQPLTRKYLYRKLRFTFARCWQVQNGLLLQRLEENAEAASFVLEIYVNWAPGVIPRQDHEDGVQLLYRLVNLFPRLVFLKRFM